MKTYADSKEFFFALKDYDYVILRNFESFPVELCKDSHPDIDILCRNSKKLAEQVGLVNRRGYHDQVHYIVEIDGINVDVDLRSVGDGYYDRKWEETILKTKVVHKELFYVPNLENYFYSLLYHALVQKLVVSEDYKLKLRDMAVKLGLDSYFDYKKTLNNYMRENDYVYTYPNSVKTRFNETNIDKGMVEKNVLKKTKRKVYGIFSAIRRKING